MEEKYYCKGWIVFTKKPAAASSSFISFFLAELWAPVIQIINGQSEIEFSAELKCISVLDTNLVRVFQFTHMKNDSNQVEVTTLCSTAVFFVK